MEFPYQFTGVDPATGLPLFKDLNDDGFVDYQDAYVNAAWNGTALPTTWGGLGNYFTYKGFGFDFFIQFTEKLMSTWNYFNNPIGGMANPSEDLTGNYWKQPGDETKYPRLYSGVPGEPDYDEGLVNQYPYSTAHIVQGVYFRLKNVQLTYTVPAKLLHGKGINNMMVYLRGENLGVYTKEKLYKDPELLLPNSVPMLRTFVTGIQLTF
jgi:hypothetical protein